MEMLEQYYTATPRPSNRGVPLSAAPRPVAQPAAKPAAPMATVEGRPVRRLSQAEQEECHRLQLCFNCDEKFYRGHNKVCKRLFFVDSVDDDDDNDEADALADIETPVFSLHAVAGVLVGTPILLRVVLGDATLIALVDTGSTYNFIDEAAALLTGLAIRP
jgi:hypothetical protein